MAAAMRSALAMLGRRACITAPPGMPPLRQAAARNLEITASASELIMAQKGSSTEVLSIGCVRGDSAAAGSHLLMSQNLLRHLPPQEIRTVFRPLKQTYLCQQQRPFCASSSSNNKDVAIGKTTAAASEVMKAHKGSSKGHVDSGSLTQLERRILQLEARSTFYNDLKWVLVGPIIWTLMAVLSNHLSWCIHRKKAEEYS